MNVSPDCGGHGGPSAGVSDLSSYLQIVQGVIQRMSNMSFMIKGWVIAVFFATMVNEGGQIPFAVVALFFWGLDAYYLAQERRFRELYNEAAKPQSKVPLFLLDMSQLEEYGVKKPRAAFMHTLISPTIALLHLPLIGYALCSFYRAGPGRILWDQFVNEIAAMI